MHGDTPMKPSMDAILGDNFTHHHLGIQKEKKPIFKCIMSVPTPHFSLCDMFDFFHVKIFDLLYEDTWKGKRALKSSSICLFLN